MRKTLIALVAGLVLGASLSHVWAAGEQANCSYTSGPMTLCQLATLAQGMLDQGYSPDTPVMRVVEGDPAVHGRPLILRRADWLKPEGVVPLGARGYYQRHTDSGSVTALIIR